MWHMLRHQVSLHIVGRADEAVKYCRRSRFAIYYHVKRGSFFPCICLRAVHIVEQFNVGVSIIPMLRNITTQFYKIQSVKFLYPAFLYASDWWQSIISWQRRKIESLLRPCSQSAANIVKYKIQKTLQKNQVLDEYCFEMCQINFSGEKCTARFGKADRHDIHTLCTKVHFRWWSQYI